MLLVGKQQNNKKNYHVIIRNDDYIEVFFIIQNLFNGNAVFRFKTILICDTWGLNHKYYINSVYTKPEHII